ncbi:MAG: hypothetical protein DCF22_22505 [Leptolyngbya sp.]|nr:MAG: hypothetical protein DCF22_22505 [Leptolyngbya sp.]
MPEPQPNVRIKLNVGMIAGAIEIVLLLAAILSRKTDPHFSSFALVSALFMLFGITANFSVPKIQTFLYRRGYQPDTLYLDSPAVSGSGDTGGWLGDGISCDLGGGGGCDGGG